MIIQKVIDKIEHVHTVMVAGARTTGVTRENAESCARTLALTRQLLMALDQQLRLALDPPTLPPTPVRRKPR